jgi:4-amino-4-deoxy-L-arabinose transferase-like glycosyltransferase
MRRQLVHQGWIVLAACITFFTSLGVPALWDEDEPLYATCAREMIARGDWVVPTYNGQMFAEKPALVYWSIIAGFKTFGINELGARFWSAVLAVGTVLLTYHLGRRLFREEVGLWAALAVASSLLFTVSARAATVDSALVLVSLGALYLFAAGGIAKTEKTGNPPAGRPWFVPTSWGRFVAIYACLGVAVLAKGPVGLLVPCASLGLFLMVMNRRAELDAAGGGLSRFSRSENGTVPFSAWLVRVWRLCGPRNFLRSLWQMRPLTGAAVVLAVALPWYVMVGVRTDGQWLADFFGIANWGAFAGSRQGHGGPIWYYMPATMIGFFPWSVLLLPSLVELVRRIRGGHPCRPAYVLAACWLGVYYVFWSICGTKLPHYVLPAFPVLALLVGSLVHDWIAQPAAADRRRFRTALGIVIVVGVGMAVALPIVASIYVPGEELLGLVGAVLLIGGGTAFYLAECQRRLPAAVVFAATCVLFVTAIFGVAAVRVDRHQFARPLLADVHSQCPGNPQLASFRFIRESLVYYAGEPVTLCNSPEELRAFLDRSDCPYVMTVDEQEEAIRRLFPGELTVVARRPRFLHEGEVVVLARRPGSNVPRTAGTMTGGTTR